MFFMRHGQSTFNVVHDYTGRDPQIPDAPLSELGERQVEAAALRFNKPLDLIISSPFTRAIQTAHAMAAAQQTPIVIDPLVSEQRMYSCDIGSPVEKLQADWPALDFSKVQGGEWWQPFPEDRKDLTRRITAFRDEYGWREDAGRLLVVSHWYFIQAISGAGLDNAEVVEVRP